MKAKLYNEDRKNKFLNDTFEPDNHTRSILLSMFEQFAENEYTIDTDLCDMHPKQYAILLAECSHYNKFSSFRTNYGLLLIYRDYCLKNGLINKIKYSGNLQRFATNNAAHVTDRELYNIFDQYRKLYYKYFYHPEDLYDYLFNQLYDIRRIKNKSTRIPDNNGFANIKIENTFAKETINADELVVVYLCLLYYGIPKTQCCNIKNQDIIIDESRERIVIQLGHEYFTVGIFLREILERIMNAKYILRFRNMTATFVPKNQEYLLCYESDDTPEERIKRNKRLSDKYYKDAERQGEDVISVREIIDQGAIYRMCILSYDQHFYPKTMQDHIDLYKAVGGTGAMNIKSSRPTELRRTYIEHFNVLNNDRSNEK